MKISSGGLKDFVSIANSRNATLTAGQEFEGTGEDVSQFAGVTITWTSNVPSADPDGVHIQFSSDNTNWDIDIDVHSHKNTIVANDGGAHCHPVLARYFRVVYTNGATNQTSFRLQTIFNVQHKMIPTRANAQMDLNMDAAVVRIINDFGLEQARRQLTGQRTYFMSGYNNGIGTAYEDLIPQGGDYNWLTTATKVSFASSSTADTVAGLGCRRVEVHGLSNTGVDQEEIIALNGTTEVTTTLLYSRINRYHPENGGTYGGAHQGDITCRVDSSGAKTGLILGIMMGDEGSVDASTQYGDGEAYHCIYTVPLAKVAYLTKGYCQINTTGTKTANVKIFERDGYLTTSGNMEPRRQIWGVNEAQGYLPIEIEPSYVKMKALTDIFGRAEGSGSGTAVKMLLNFYLLDVNAAGE